MAPSAIPPVLRTPERERKRSSRHTELNVQSVVLGDLLIEPWYPSCYPPETIGAKVERLYVCKCCFRYSKELMPYISHLKSCQTTDAPPPGTLIYQSGRVAMYEIDGSEHKLYTQNLSLFAKLFLDTKSVFFDVTTFRFYVMTFQETATTKPQVVGFFSKEKMSWDNNNLACILVFPPWQRKGLGQILMGISYELSRREGQLGGPEKPLSSLGRKGYSAYWSGEIARAILAARKDRLSIEDIVQQTWIPHEDVIATLSSMDLGQTGAKQPQDLTVMRQRVADWAQRHKISLQPPIDAAAFIDIS